MPPDLCVKTLCTNIHFDIVIYFGYVVFLVLFQYYDQIGGFNFSNTKIIFITFTFFQSSRKLHQFYFSAKHVSENVSQIIIMRQKICKKKNKL